MKDQSALGLQVEDIYDHEESMQKFVNQSVESRKNGAVRIDRNNLIESHFPDE